MKRAKRPRRRRTDLLARPPDAGQQDGIDALIFDPVEQLEELEDLYARGILSGEEFESQKRRVLPS